MKIIHIAEHCIGICVINTTAHKILICMLQSAKNLTPIDVVKTGIGCQPLLSKTVWHFQRIDRKSHFGKTQKTSSKNHPCLKIFRQNYQIDVLLYFRLLTIMKDGV